MQRIMNNNRDPTIQLPSPNLYKAKKKQNKSEKDMVSTVYFFLCQLLQFSFKNCFVAENLRQAGRYAEKTLFHFNA